MLNENGRLGGLVKSQETLLGRGIAQQLVLEEGILGASRGQAPLEAALARAAAGNGSWPYRKSLAAAKWIRGICEAVRGLSEGALALAGGAGAWLNLAAAADGEIHELTRLLEVEGMAQNSMDGMEELRLALATLDPKRVAGGKETVADWKRRLSRLEAIIQEAQEESQLQGTLQDLVTQARGHTDPRQLKIVVEAATTRGSNDGEDARRLTRHRIAGPPTGFIFFQDAWEEMDTRAALWPHPEFLGLVHNQSTARARACMLLLARRCFAPEALQQLWHSLRPLEGPVAFQDYLRDFVKQAYTRGEAPLPEAGLLTSL